MLQVFGSTSKPTVPTTTIIQGAHHELLWAHHELFNTARRTGDIEDVIDRVALPSNLQYKVESEVKSVKLLEISGQNKNEALCIHSVRSHRPVEGAKAQRDDDCEAQPHGVVLGAPV